MSSGLPQVLVAVVLLSVGGGAAASLTRSAARAVVVARALEEIHLYVGGFVDSIRVAGGSGAGERHLDVGTLVWEVGADDGSVGAVTFHHVALVDPVRFAFVRSSLP